MQVLGIENNGIAKAASRISRSHRNKRLATKVLAEAVKFRFEKIGSQRLYTDVDTETPLHGRVKRDCAKYI